MENRSGQINFAGWQRFSHISVGGGFAPEDEYDEYDEYDVLNTKSNVPFDEKLPVLWAVNAAGVVYKRQGITRENRKGTSWTAISAFPPMREVSVNGDGKTIWGLSQEPTYGGYKVYYRMEGGRFWIPLGGRGAKTISAF